jgi:hypothetical protein
VVRSPITVRSLDRIWCRTGNLFPGRRTYVRWLSGRITLLVVCCCKKISSSVSCQSTGLRPALSHMCCGAAVYGWGRGSEILPM